MAGVGACNPPPRKLGDCRRVAENEHTQTIPTPRVSSYHRRPRNSPLKLILNIN